MRNLLTALAVAAMLATMAAVPASGLTPEQIILVVRQSDPLGQQAARYYCQQRSAPRENIVVLDVPGGESIAWSVYQAKVVEPLRQALQRKKLSETARCLLLVGSLPLKVEPDPTSPLEKLEVKQINDFLTRLALEIYQQGVRLEQLMQEQASGPLPDKLPGNIRNFWEAERYYYEVVQKAAPAINNLPAERRRPPAERLARIRAELEGYCAQIGPEPRDHRSPDFRQRYDEWRRDFDAKIKPQLDKKLTDVETRRQTAAADREDRRRKVKEARGLLGLAHQLNDDVNEINSSARMSALDSELALLWRDNYKLTNSQPNGLFGKGGKPDADKLPTMMVARLDGFDRAGPIRLIDDALAVEKAGQPLAGEFCIDARGLPTNDPQHYDDQLLLGLETWKDRPATMPLAKDASLVSIPSADANPVAFYVGWPAVDKFPGGYTCARGAIAITCGGPSIGELHDARSRQWSNGWLAAGATVVIGSVDQALPRDFVDFQAFGRLLLVDGLPLAEAYWSSCRTTSWRVILVGDPLYRPAAKKPAPAPPNNK